MEYLKNIFSDSLYEDFARQVRNTDTSDIISNALYGISAGAALSTLPAVLQPFAQAMLFWIKNTADKNRKQKVYDELYKLQDVANKESTKIAKESSDVRAPRVEESSIEKFDKFDEGNIVLFGVTQSGKTTNFITWCFNDLISNFDLFILVGSDLLKNESIQEMRTGIQYALMKQDKEFNDNVFAFFNRTQLDDAIDFASQNKSAKKLVFFDDIQLDGSGRKFDKVALFTQECKHAGCTVVTSLHMSFNDKGAEIIRSSARYFALFNQPEQNFNRLLKLEKGNRLWRKYNMIVDIHERILIHDNVTGKNFFGTWPYSRMDPLIASEEDSQQ